MMTKAHTLGMEALSESLTRPKFVDALKALAKATCEDYKACLPNEFYLGLELAFAKERVKEMVCGVPKPGQDVAAACRE